MTILDRILTAARSLVAAPPEPVKADSLTSMPSLWSNAFTGLGTAGADRSVSHAPGALTPIDDETLAELWQGDPIASTGIEAIVDDGMRKGFEPCYHGEVEADKDKIQDVSDLIDELGLVSASRLAAKSARALRGGGLLLETNGGRGFAGQPLVDERVTSVDRLVVWDSRDMRVATWRVGDHLDYWYSPVSQTLTEQAWGAKIHCTHAVVFPGLDTPLRDRQQRWEGWYKPVLQHVGETLRDFRQSNQSAVAMLQDGSQGVLYLPDLARTIATAGRSVLETRLSLIQLYRWIGRIMPLDAGSADGTPQEKFEWAERGFAGIADMLKNQMPLVAQALGMPMTRLWGDFSTAGLNNAGAGAERNWLLTVDAHRVAKIQPGVERVVRLLAKQVGARDWQRWGIEWPELEVLSSAERATLEKTEAEIDDLRIQQGMPAEVVLKHRFGQGAYTHSPPLLTEEDIAAIEAAKEADEQAAREAAEDPAAPPVEGVTPPQLAPFAEKAKAAAGEEPPADDDPEDEDEEK